MAFASNTLGGGPRPRANVPPTHGHGFSAHYAHAREAQADCWADEIVAMADDAPADHEVLAKVRLQIDARKWVASKLLPCKYGYRVSAELTGANGGPIKRSSPSPSSSTCRTRICSRCARSCCAPPGPWGRTRRATMAEVDSADSDPACLWCGAAYRPRGATRKRFCSDRCRGRVPPRLPSVSNAGGRRRVASHGRHSKCL